MEHDPFIEEVGASEAKLTNLLQQRKDNPPRLSPLVPPPLAEYVNSQVTTLAAHISSARRLPQNLNESARKKQQFFTFCEIQDQLTQPTPQYEKLATHLDTEITQRTRDQERLSTEMQRGFADDGRFMALQERRRKATAIRAKLTDPQEQAFMTQLDSEWKGQQSATERGTTLAAIATQKSEIARFQHLRQLVPAQATAGK